MSANYTGALRLRVQRSVSAIAIGALMIALAICLEYAAKVIPGLEMPNGGTFSLTCLPLVLASLAIGPLWGSLAGFIYGLLDFFIDGYGLHWGSLFLDYLLAFSFMGLAGLFSKKFVKGDWWVFYPAMTVAMVFRYLSSSFSGVLFFADYAGSMNPWFYSFLFYNAPYMGVSLLLDLLIGSYLIFPLSGVVKQYSYLLLPKGDERNDNNKIDAAKVPPVGTQPVRKAEDNGMAVEAKEEAGVTFKEALLGLADPSTSCETAGKDLDVIRQESDNGNARASVLLGILYEEGLFAEYDLDKAEQYYQKAYDQGGVNGQFRLGALYLGDNAKHDVGNGLALVREAASKGLPEALAVLGQAYEKGVGVDKDLGKAEEFYVDAAHRGLGYGYYLLGSLKSDQGEFAEAKEDYDLAVKLGYDATSKKQDFLSLLGR